MGFISTDYHTKRLEMQTAKPMLSIGTRYVSIVNKDTKNRESVPIKDILQASFAQINQATTPQKKLEAKAMLENVKNLEAGSRNCFMRLLNFLGIKNAYTKRDKQIAEMEKLLSIDEVFNPLMAKVKNLNANKQTLPAYEFIKIPAYEFIKIEKSYGSRKIIIKVKESDTNTITTNFDELYKTLLNKIHKAEYRDEIGLLHENFEKLAELDKGSRQGKGEWKTRNTQITTIRKNIEIKNLEIKRDESIQPELIGKKLESLDFKIKVLESGRFRVNGNENVLTEDLQACRKQKADLETKLEKAKLCDALYKKISTKSDFQNNLKNFVELFKNEKSYRAEELAKINGINFDDVFAVLNAKTE